MANDDPLDALIPKIPFSFFANFWVWVTSEAWGSVSVGCWGSRQLGPLLGGGGVLAKGLYRPPPPLQLKARLPVYFRGGDWTGAYSGMHSRCHTHGSASGLPVGSLRCSAGQALHAPPPCPWPAPQRPLWMGLAGPASPKAATPPVTQIIPRPTHSAPSATPPPPRGLLEGEGALGANSEQLQSGWGAL